MRSSLLNCRAGTYTPMGVLIILNGIVNVNMNDHIAALLAVYILQAAVAGMLFVVLNISADCTLRPVPAFVIKPLFCEVVTGLSDVAAVFALSVAAVVKAVRQGLAQLLTVIAFMPMVLFVCFPVGIKAVPAFTNIAAYGAACLTVFAEIVGGRLVLQPTAGALFIVAGLIAGPLFWEGVGRNLIHLTNGADPAVISLIYLLPTGKTVLCGLGHSLASKGTTAFASLFLRTGLRTVCLL